MATNDQVEIKDEDIKEEDFSSEELENDSTDWKAKALELKGIAKRRATQLAKAKEKLATKPEPELIENKSDEPNYGKLAYLETKGVLGEDVDWALSTEKESGKSLAELFNSKWFVAELKERKEAKITADATPSASRRSTSGARDQVDYWLAKGELPPIDQPELRRAYVNGRAKKEANLNKFTDRPVGNTR